MNISQANQGAFHGTFSYIVESRIIIFPINQLKSAGAENPKIPKELKTVIAEYLEEGFRWFVFDVVQLEREPKTNEAIQYRFIKNGDPSALVALLKTIVPTPSIIPGNTIKR